MAARSRAEVVESVRTRTPIDERERQSIERFLVEIERLGDDAFDEHADPVHVTASALILGPRGLVLQRHRLLGIWVAPGGHIDPDETPWDAAVREAQEETGLSVTLAGRPPQLAHVDVHPGPRGHTHLDLRYVVRGGDADPAPPPDESQDVYWFTWAEALVLTEPGMTSLLRHFAATY